jgi:hypothetical protein
MKNFIVIIPYMHTVYLEQVHPLCYISFLLSLFLHLSGFDGFQYAVFICIDAAFFRKAL